jgi:hypothetical protein
LVRQLGPRLEHFLFHGVAAVVSREHATLIDLARLYTDDRFRERVVGRVTDPETLRRAYSVPKT